VRASSKKAGQRASELTGKSAMDSIDENMSVQLELDWEKKKTPARRGERLGGQFSKGSVQNIGAAEGPRRDVKIWK